ncbi:MAG: LamG domain-containing protein [Candidatus Bathyarchaeia archaeon]
MRIRGLSPLLATLILIAIVVSAGAAIYLSIMNMTSTLSNELSVQLASANLVVSGNSALLTVSVKNVGNTPLAGIVVAGYDDNGKCFKLALPPAEPGQTSGNTLIIPLNVPFIALDGSGNNNHGAIYGATWVDGIYGKALNFNGVDDYVEISNSGDMRFPQQTVTLWVNPDYQISGAFQYHKDIIRKGDEWGFSTLGSFNTNPKITVEYRYFGGTPYWCIPSTPLNIGNWNFIAVTWNRDQAKINTFINGVSEEFSVATGTPFYHTLPLKLATGHAGYFKGVLDEVCVYNRASVEVESNVIRKGLPPTDGLVLWLPLDEGSNAPFSFTAGGKYALTVTAYTLDGSTTTQAITVVAAA